MDSTFQAPKPMRKTACSDLLEDTARISHNGYMMMLSMDWILKQAKKIGRFPWIHKYTVIHDGCLYIFKDGQAKKAQVSISLYGYNKVARENDPKTIGDMGNAFKLEPIQDFMKTFYFSVPSEKERVEWMAKMKQAMLYANGRVCSRISQSSIDSLSIGSVEESVYDSAEDFQQSALTNNRPTPDIVTSHPGATGTSAWSGGGGGGGDDDSDSGGSYSDIKEEDIEEFNNIRDRYSGGGSGSGTFALPPLPPKPEERASPVKRPLPADPTKMVMPTSRPPPPPKPEAAKGTTLQQIRDNGNVQQKAAMFGGDLGRRPPGGQALLPGMMPPAASHTDRAPPPIPQSKRPSATPSSPGDDWPEGVQPDYMEPRGSVFIEDETFNWEEVYWPDVDREGSPHAFRMLTQKGQEGGFLVRDGGGAPGEYTLCVFADKQPRKYKINQSTQNQMYYIKNGEEFSSILKLLAHYADNHIPNRPGCFLTIPYSKC